MLDCATEGHMHLPDLTAAKARSCHRQSDIGWSVVETPMINRPGARAQRSCRQRRSVELDAVRGQVADRQEELQTLQPVVGDILVGEPARQRTSPLPVSWRARSRSARLTGSSASTITVSAPTSVRPGSTGVSLISRERLR